MSDHMKYQGLCTTCNYAPSCVRMKNINMPVLYCEEFDDYVPSPLKIVTGDIAQSKEKTYDKSTGLCCNCENREICVIPKSEGGIWHCEEYR